MYQDHRRPSTILITIVFTFDSFRVDKNDSFSLSAYLSGRAFVWDQEAGDLISTTELDRE